MNSKTKNAKPGTRRKSSQVPGPYLGYSLQPTRLLDLALDAQPGSVLTIEVFEDVGIVQPGGNTVASQTKTALASNPISNHSIELWKTLSNWLSAVESGMLPMQGTLFEIYLAKSRSGQLAALLHLADTETQAIDALQKARDLLWGSSPKYSKKAKLATSLAPFVNHVLDPQSIHAAQLITRFRLNTAKKDPLRDLRPKVAAKWVRPESVELVIKHAHGWIKEIIDDLILAGKPAAIRVDDFNAEIASFLPRCDFKQILVAMAGDLEISQSTVADQQLRTYVRQLALIDHPEEDIIESINNYLRASAERAAWSRAGLVHEDSFDDYENALVTYWKNKKAINNVAFNHHTGINRGKLLLAECCNCQQRLQGLEVPAFFNPGSYHALAESLAVGWHPEYTRLISSGSDVKSK